MDYLASMFEVLNGLLNLYSFKVLFIVLTRGVKKPDETRGRHFKGRNRRDTGQEEGGTHVFYSDFSGHGTETSK